MPADEPFTIGSLKCNQGSSGVIRGHQGFITIEVAPSPMPRSIGSLKCNPSKAVKGLRSGDTAGCTATTTAPSRGSPRS
jgi:hypothetical protein